MVLTIDCKDVPVGREKKLVTPSDSKLATALWNSSGLNGRLFIEYDTLDI